MDPNISNDNMEEDSQPLSQPLDIEANLSALDYAVPVIALSNMYWGKTIIEAPDTPNFQIVEDIIDLWNFLIQWNNHRNECGDSMEYLAKNPLSAESLIKGEYIDYGHFAFALAIPADWFPATVTPVGFGKVAEDPAIIKPSEIPKEKLSVDYMVKYWSENRVTAGGCEWLFDQPSYRSGNKFVHIYSSHIVYYDNHIPSLHHEEKGSTYYGWMRIALALHFMNWIKDILFSHFGASRSLITSALLQSERAMKLKKIRGHNQFIAENIVKPDFMKQTLCKSARRHAGLYGTSALMNANRMHPTCGRVISGFYQREHERIGIETDEYTSMELITEIENKPERFEPKHEEALAICARFLFENCRRVQHTLSWTSLFQTRSTFPIGGTYTEGWCDLVSDPHHQWRLRTPAELYREYLSWNERECNDTSGCGEFTKFFTRILNDTLGTAYSKTILSPQDPEILRLNLDLFPEDPTAPMNNELADLSFIKIGNDNLPTHEFVSPPILARGVSEIDFSASVLKFRDPNRYKSLLTIHNDTCVKKQRPKPY